MCEKYISLHFISIQFGIWNNGINRIYVAIGNHDLEMELSEFQGSIVWKNKFKKLISEVEGEISETGIDDNLPN